MKRIRVTSSGPLLSLNLEDSEGIQAPRHFLVQRGRITIIPLNFAKSIFNYPGATAMYREGTLIVQEGKELLVGETEKLGYQVPDTTNQAEIVNILKGNNVTAVRKLFEGKNKEVALNLAGEHKEEMSQIVLKEIEEITGFSLLVE